MNYNCQQRLRNNIHPSLYLNGNTENIETVGKMPPRVSSGAGCSVQLRDNKPRRSTTAVSTTRSSSLRAHGPQLSRIVLWELVTGATEFYATQPARLRIIIYLCLINIVFI